MGWEYETSLELEEWNNWSSNSRCRNEIIETNWNDSQ